MHMIFFTHKTKLQSFTKGGKRYVEEIKELDGSCNADHSNMPKLRDGKCQ